MNLDKQSVAAVVLGALALIAWFVYSPKMTPPAPAQTPATVQQSAVPAPQAVPQPAPQTTPRLPAKLAKLPEVTLPGAEADYVFDPLSGTLARVELKKYFRADREHPLTVTNDFPSLAHTGAEYGAFGVRAANGSPLYPTAVEQSGQERQYRLTRTMQDGFGQTFRIEGCWTVADNGILHCVLNIINSGARAIQVPALVLSAGDLPAWDKLSGDPYGRSQELHTVDYCTTADKVDYLSADASDSKLAGLAGTPVRWFGASNRFFAMLLKTDTPLLLTARRAADPSCEKSFLLSIGGELPSFELAPGASRTLTLDYFLGPKQPDPLRAFDAKAAKVMRLGWFPIDFLAYIMLALLNWLHGFVGSFGWSIILLTLLVRTVFFPVTMKANASMRDMQALAPEVKAIREKYKDEPMMAQTKISELYRERHINPLGGCLPMLIQIPVFIALYYALGSAVELRQQSFWWIRDLSQPDTVAKIFGIGIHPLIIAWTGLMLVQQKLTPTTMEPMQAKMMMVMPLVMLFFLYDLPSALTLYWTVSQIFSIVQMRYQQHLKKRNEQSAPPADQGQAGKKPRIVRS